MKGRLDILTNKVHHLKEVETLLLRGNERGLLREVRRLISGYEKEILCGKRIGKW